MSEANPELMRLLQEIRDAQREHLEWSRRAVETSLDLQRAGLRRQIVAIFVLAVVMAALIAVLSSGVTFS